MDKPSLQPLPSFTQKSGFSLVEVAMSIGIIAFAFVALFALIPTGLTTFRESIDTSNETWIMQNMNSMVQTTEFRKVESLGYEKSQEIYYFDEEGKLTDSENKPANDAKLKADRLYAVKLIVEKLERPNGMTGEEMPHGWRVLAVFAPYQNGRAMEDFKKVENASSLRGLPATTVVHSRSFVVARMDSEREAR